MDPIEQNEHRPNSNQEKSSGDIVLTSPPPLADEGFSSRPATVIIRDVEFTLTNPELTLSDPGEFFRQVSLVPEAEQNIEINLDEALVRAPAKIGKWQGQAMFAEGDSEFIDGGCTELRFWAEGSIETFASRTSRHIMV